MDSPANRLDTQRLSCCIRQWPVLLAALLLCACSGETPPRDAVVLAFGDSLTRGSGAAREYSYPAWLERLTNRRIINAGIPGEISAQGRERLPQLLDQHQPDLLILCHGANDLLRRMDTARTRENLIAMIEQAESRGIEVILVGVPQFALLRLEAAPLYEEIAAQYQLLYEGEVLAEVIADNELMSDRIHPNAEGYRIIATAIQRLLETSSALR